MTAKRLIDDLARFGGAPAFAAPVHVGRPNIGDRERFLGRVNAILDSRWLTNDGAMLREFEARIAALAGTAHCVAFCNATIALEVLLEALQLDGEVIVPSFTFVATAHALLRQRLTPLFCDADPRTHNLDPAAVQAALTPRTAAILGVHLWGRPCDVNALQAIADARGIPLLFDAAHALASSYNGRAIGAFGTAEVFSFHATKFVNSFEGGAITTNDAALADRLRLARNFGFLDEDTIVALGTNGKMSEVSAAMGLTSLESVDDYLAVNARNHAAYEEALADLPGIRFVTAAGGDDWRGNLQYVVVEIDGGTFGLTRDQLLEILRAENVLARRYFYPGCHRAEPYRSMQLGYAPLPETERIADRVLSLPTGTSVGVDDIGRITEIVCTAAENATAIAARLR